MIEDVTNHLLVTGMDMQITKHTVSALNVSNYKNEGAKKITVSFEQELQKLRSAQEGNYLQQELFQVSGLKGKAQYSESDISSIDLAAETQKSLQAEGRYKTMVELLNKRLGMLSLGIKGSK